MADVFHHNYLGRSRSKFGSLQICWKKNMTLDKKTNLVFKFLTLLQKHGDTLNHLNFEERPCLFFSWAEKPELGYLASKILMKLPHLTPWACQKSRLMAGGLYLKSLQTLRQRASLWKFTQTWPTSLWRKLRQHKATFDAIDWRLDLLWKTWENTKTTWTTHPFPMIIKNARLQPCFHSFVFVSEKSKSSKDP